MYKIQFEAVLPMGPGAKYYKGEKPACHPMKVPDEAWVQSEREADDPWQQYNTLKEWEASGEHFIRNVRLFKADDYLWKEVKGQRGNVTI